MCYSIYFSTDCPDDPTSMDPGLYTVEPVPTPMRQDLKGLLAYPNVWYLASYGGDCSCHYRHLMSVELGFSEPEDWFEEDPDDVERTEAVHGFFKRIVDAGYRLDVVDYWGELPDCEFDKLGVSLSEVGPKQFRFFEGYRFELTA